MSELGQRRKSCRLCAFKPVVQTLAEHDELLQEVIQIMQPIGPLRQRLIDDTAAADTAATCVSREGRRSKGFRGPLASETASVCEGWFWDNRSP